jgi:hypothetical protein
MGNERSGRWSDPGAKMTVEECHALDIRHWGREGWLQPGTFHVGSWGWRGAGTGHESSIDYSIDMLSAPHARLQYQLTKTGEHLDYMVALVSTHPNYGGLRWWFVCPIVVAGHACRRRVGKLYLAPGRRYFACRHCCDLAYTSQREDKMTRALSKAQAIRVRLGGSGAIDYQFPPKPNRMRWKTYHLLWARSQELRVESFRAALGLPAGG